MRKKNTSTRTKRLNWSKAVRERDKNQCFLCGTTWKLNAHHILPKRMWGAYKYEPRVGITLCCKCHSFGKFSVHRGAGDMLLFEKLKKERPEQYEYLLELIKSEKFLREFKKDEQWNEPLDELDWPENQVDDDGSDDWCKNGW